ncbi:MAG: ATP-binding cassette domain-containing protein [bacterium]|nr:ATP-binding cassette domain-containing protein [bacterium]
MALIPGLCTHRNQAAGRRITIAPNTKSNKSGGREPEKTGSAGAANQIGAGIRIENLTASVGRGARRNRVLHDISCECPPGAVTALIGPSGSGKSTLLRQINGLIAPERGRIFVGGRAVEPADREGVIALRRRIGYAVQNSALFPHMSVRENITLLARYLEAAPDGDWSATRTEERLTRLMEMMRLPLEYQSRYPYELSGGEQQRVGLCRAMFAEPAVLLLDEPFGALDPVTRREIHAEFRALRAAEPVTVVLVTHDLNEALELGDRLIVLNAGRIAQQAAPRDVLDAPADDFVREFLHRQLEGGR